MMYRLIRWLLHKFDYELVSFAEMAFLNKAVNDRYKLVSGLCLWKYRVSLYREGCYNVEMYNGEGVSAIVKKFYASDYGSKEYAEACAKELCDKLNDKP